MGLATIDVIVVVAYALVIFGLAQWVSRDKAGHEKNTSDYFLASKSLPWWAIGASLIAANISAEQIVGMSGSGYRLGLAIASYEWMAALTLLIVGKFFLPIFLKNGIFTMPQFLEQRYGPNIRTLMAVFWLGLYIFVNLTSILWLGSIVVNQVAGVNQMTALVALGSFALLYQLYGGLKAVALTDIVQVTLLVLGGLIISGLTLNEVGGGQGVWAGFTTLLDRAPEKFNMILEPGDLGYQELPGIAVLVGGMWIANLSYWGFNQYIIQRALAGKSLKEAQRGLAFAGGLKMILPLIVVIPGIVAFGLDAPIDKADQAYPWLLGTYIGPGLKGLAFAALAAAIVSSLASMMNSTATIFTIDLYKSRNPDTSETKLVTIGRLVSLAAITIAAITAYPLLGAIDQAFQYIQEYTGFISPGVLAVFMMGLFWRKATANAALVTAVLSIPLSALAKVLLPAMPFLNRMGYVFLLSVALIVVISLIEGKGADSPKAIRVADVDRGKDPVFLVSAFAILGVTAVLYAMFW